MSEVRSDLKREQERTGRVSAPVGAAVGDGAGAAAGKSAAVQKLNRLKKIVLNHHCTNSELNQKHAGKHGLPGSDKPVSFLHLTKLNIFPLFATVLCRSLQTPGNILKYPETRITFWY